MALRTTRPTSLTILSTSLALAGALAACGPGGTATDAGMDTSPGTDAAGDAVLPQDSSAPTDAADAGTPPGDGAALAFVAHFDPAMGQFPEGVLLANGRRYVSFAPSHQVATLDDSFAVHPFGSVPPPAPPPDAGASYLSFMLDLEADGAGNVYAPVATFGGSEPATGVYRIAATGGAGTIFTTGTTARPMIFPNGTDLIGTTLYVADSAGAIFAVDTSTGATQVWSTDSHLQGDQTACGGNGAGFSVGANNIDHDASNLYVTVSDLGIVLRIPIQSDGSAGTPVVIVQDCAIAGDDGLDLAPNGDVILAIGRGKIARVTPAGVITTLYAGAPLDFPTDVWFDTVNGRPALLITNGAYFTATDPQVGILSLTPVP